MTTILESFRAVAAKPQLEQAQTIKETMNALPEDQKQAVAEALGLNSPDPSTNNTVWLIIIWAFAIAMLSAVFVLCYGYLKPPASSNGIKPDMILTIFTTVTAFLAGLFAPSPVTKKAGG